MKRKKLTDEGVEKLASLAALQITSGEVEKYAGQLDETLAFMDNLSKLQTDRIEPTNHATELTDVFFEDGVENKRGLTREQALQNTKNKKRGMFVVKRII